MVPKPWPTDHWPQGVAHDIPESDYLMPLYQILDEAARDYPDNVYTVFNEATRTFADVKETADRVASFLVTRGIQRGYDPRRRIQCLPPGR
jgi:long-chain acyl-CoA synthetase